MMALPAVNADHDLILRLAGYTGGEMASPPARRAMAPPGPPAFSDRAQAGLQLGAALLAVLGPAQVGPARASDAERTLPGPVPPPRPVSGDRVGGDRPRVFALPRGGVPVAAGV